MNTKILQISAIAAMAMGNEIYASSLDEKLLPSGDEQSLDEELPPLSDERSLDEERLLGALWKAQRNTDTSVCYELFAIHPDVCPGWVEELSGIFGLRQFRACFIYGVNPSGDTLSLDTVLALFCKELGEGLGDGFSSHTNPLGFMEKFSTDSDGRSRLNVSVINGIRESKTDLFKWISGRTGCRVIVLNISEGGCLLGCLGGFKDSFGQLKQYDCGELIATVNGGFFSDGNVRSQLSELAHDSQEKPTLLFVPCAGGICPIYLNGA